MPRIRWVIDENFLYAYRDYELISGLDGEPVPEGEDLGHPVAAYKIDSHFDIKRDYNTVTGEEVNLVMENTEDRRWYERDYMRVDWSQNLLPGYYGQVYNLYEVLGLFTREPAELYVQSLSDFPDSWRPRFHYMPCNGSGDTSAECTDAARDWADDYAQGELYAMDFVNQEILSPGLVPDPFTGAPVNWCASIYSDAPLCTTFAVYVRTSFLKVSDSRQYEAENWVDSRFEVAGYFRNEQPTYDRSLGATDPGYGSTDFLNYSVNRHNIWKNWHDEAGNPIRTRTATSVRSSGTRRPSFRPTSSSRATSSSTSGTRSSCARSATFAASPSRSTRAWPARPTTRTTTASARPIPTPARRSSPTPTAMVSATALAGTTRSRPPTRRPRAASRTPSSARSWCRRVPSPT